MEIFASFTRSNSPNMSHIIPLFLESYFADPAFYDTNSTTSIIANRYLELFSDDIAICGDT